LLKTSDSLSFALITSSDESQSKSQFNTLSLEENKTDVHRVQEKSTFVYIDIYTLLIMYYYGKQCQFATNYRKTSVSPPWRSIF